MTALYITLAVLGGLIVLLAAAWLFCIGAKSGKALGELKNVRYAHRGLHTQLDYDTPAAENSLTAFSRAVESGYGIELDVRFSSDGVVMVFHDDTLKRMCGVEKRVNELTAEELGKLRLGETDDTVPTFRQVLDLVDGKIPLLVELKGEGTETEIARATVEMLKDYKGEYIIESFNPLLLGAVKKADPKIPRGFLVCHHTKNERRRTLKYRLIQHYMLNFIARPHFIAMDKNAFYLFPHKLVCRLFGTAVMSWTTRTPAEEEKARANGATGVIFEKYRSGKAEGENA